MSPEDLSPEHSLPQDVLPEDYRQQYQTFERALQRLKGETTRPHPDCTTLQSDFLDVQQLFQLRISSLNLEVLDPAIAARLQSVHTEIHKQLRLLGMDVAFLQAARQSITTQQRQAQMRDRLHIILQFCNGILATVEPE